MSETIKAICIIGGEVKVSMGKNSSKGGFLTDFSETWMETQSGLCEKPRSCIRRDICTGDVKVAIAGGNVSFCSIVQATFTEQIDLERAISYKPSHAELYAETLKKMLEMKK